jgi:hypothetical protein
VARGMTAPTRTTSAADAGKSGWRFSVVRQGGDVNALAKDLQREFRAGADKRMQAAQKLIRDEVKKTLGSVLGRPSRAGEPPAKVSGDLQRSVKIGKRYWNKEGTILRGEIRITHPAAARHEFGSRGGKDKRGRPLNTPARPYYRPTLARIADQITRVLLGDE